MLIPCMPAMDGRHKELEVGDDEWGPPLSGRRGATYKLSLLVNRLQPVVALLLYIVELFVEIRRNLM